MHTIFRIGPLFISVTALALVAGCTGVVRGNAIRGSGDIVTREESVSGFVQVRASHGFNVDIRRGEEYQVTIRVDDNLVPYLVVEKQGNALRIGLEPNNSYLNTTLQAEVTMPTLTGVEASGGSDVRVAGFGSTERLNVNISGGGSLRGDIDAGAADFELSGGSEMQLSGSGRDLRLEVSGGGNADLANFTVRDVDANLSGGSQATVNASGTIDAVASGGARLFYLDSPTLGNIETSGGAAVRQR
jgi:hypothetical protein